MSMASEFEIGSGGIPMQTFGQIIAGLTLFVLWIWVGWVIYRHYQLWIDEKIEWLQLIIASVKAIALSVFLTVFIL
jgi:integrating conjugative element protein (TIGR03758 family)